jgi:hypothetical protein
MSARAPLAVLALAALGACRSAGTGEAEPADDAWAWQLAGYAVDPPDDDVYGSAVVRGDRGALHVEGRYNYEDLDTGSVFAGRTFAWEGDVELSLVPMIGGVFGGTNGVAPGLEVDVVWRRLELYVESEYVFDLEEADDSFFFAWTELTFSPADWLSLGFVGQRTRAREMELEMDRGLLAGFSWDRFGGTVYLFNPDQDDPYVMIGVTIDF